MADARPESAATKAETPHQSSHDPEPASARRLRNRGLAALAIAVMPAVAAIWAVPWFVTQDGPAHLYNAEILARSFDPDSPFAGVFAIRWQPIPNWAGHLLLAGMVRALPAWAADRIAATATLAGFAAAIFWLRLRVAGPRPGPGTSHLPAAMLAALLAMSVTWLLGFTNFLLGACLFPITLGFWWPRRDRVGAAGIAGLWALLSLGYFCHLVSLGLTVLGLCLLAVAGPWPGSAGEPAWRRLRPRIVPLAMGFLPLVPLGLVYLAMAHRGGPMQPRWENLADPLTLAGWKAQLGWVDPITLSRKDTLPFTDRSGPLFAAFAPVLWMAAALIVWGAARMADRIRGARDRETSPVGRRGWWLLATLLIVGGIIGPDTMGAEHGNYLQQRVVLFGLVALAAVVEIDLKRRPGRVAAAAIGVAVALQSAIVWDYALASDRTAGEIIAARDGVGRGRRVVFLPATVRGRFRANPLLHVDNWLGVDTANIIWNNYEAVHYYFPIHFRPGVEGPPSRELGELMSRDGPGDAAGRARLWESLLARRGDAIDVLVAYRSDPALDAVSARFFREVRRRGDVRILVREPGRSRSLAAASR